MSRRLPLLGLALLLLSGCDPEQKLDSDRIAIVSAVLAKEFDGASDRKAVLLLKPELKLFYEDLVDFRQCVSAEVAGKAGDFDRQHLEEPGAALVERWKNSDHRFPLKNQIDLPYHLRWDSPFSHCPSGVLYLGTPEISGDSARVFIRRECSGWCGWGGEISLRRQAGRWQVERETTWWWS